MEEALNGLVLAGGKSTRMGQSKAKMIWYGKEQQYHLADLLRKCCREVFISCRKDQVGDLLKDYKVLPDSYPSAGPLEAILSALEKFPDRGWMIVACDLPLLNDQTLDYLKQQRDLHKIATVFENPEDGLPEPLIGIWEPKSYEMLKMYQQKEHLSLRKILIKHGAKIIKASETDALINVNTPDDVKRIEQILERRASSNP